MKLSRARINDILNVTETVNRLKDIDALLDRVLLEARAFTNADAGSIFLIEGDKLKFSYVQNDTLIRQDRNRALIYVNQEMVIDSQSIAGHVALTHKPLVIDDVYRLGEEVPYRFNRAFDRSSAYRTQSVLTVPLQTSLRQVIGVIQIINRQDEKGAVVPFSREDEQVVFYFAGHAAAAIERARMTREIILRMIRIAELRDPQETAAHVNRVGSYAIEIYRRWAHNRGIPLEEIKHMSDILRIAAMLHDVGKVAIPDAILKKRARLIPEEFEQLKWHTILGARLFKNSTSDWDDMAAEIALNHHEKWDGSGYPGPIRDLFDPRFRIGKGKQGEEIPLLARIVALADVYDALVSTRCYKKSWPEERVLALIKAEKEKHFDPEVVDTFLSIHDVILAIKSRYPL